MAAIAAEFFLCEIVATFLLFAVRNILEIYRAAVGANCRMIYGREKVFVFENLQIGNGELFVLDI